LSAEKKGLDLCIVSARTESRPSVEIAALGDIKVGQAVYAIGNPLDLAQTLSNGIVSSIRIQDGFSVIQTTAPISPGSSGGGLFLNDGRLIGITTFTFSEGQNLNFAIPGEYIRAAETLGLAQDEESILPASRAQFTFKGVPFGSSIASFRQQFPGLKCIQSEGNVDVQFCNVGPIQYLVRGGGMYATFASERLMRVELLWGESNADERIRLAEGACAKVVAQFGEPTEGRCPVPAKWRLSEDQSIGLRVCPGVSLFVCQHGVGTMITLEDRRFSVGQAPDRDF
jgi:hypothetical protein